MASRNLGFSYQDHLQKYLAEPVKSDTQKRNNFGFSANSCKHDVNQNALVDRRNDASVINARMTEWGYNSDYELSREGLMARGFDENPECELYQEGHSIFVATYRRRGQ